MGLVYSDIELSNPRDAGLASMAVSALVDTGAITLCISEHVVVQLQSQELEKREVTTADGKSIVVPYVGPVQIHFAK